jgi:hypothetical protein
MKRRNFLATPALGALYPFTGPWVENIMRGPDEPVRSGDEKPQSTFVAPATQHLHPDFVTFVDGIEYFHLGNGDIQAVVQYSPANPETSFFGLTIWDPEIFSRKWSTYLYHPERGFSNTRLGVNLDETKKSADRQSGMYSGVRGHFVTKENLEEFVWGRAEGIPAVVVRWKAEQCEIREEFFTPTKGAALFRRVTVTNGHTRALDVQVGLSLYANFGLFDRIAVDEKEKCATAAGLARMSLFSLSPDATVAGRYDVRVPMAELKPGESRSAVFVYTLHDAASTVNRKSWPGIISGTQKGWEKRSTFSSGNEILDHCFDVSRSGLRGVLARSGRLDGGQWMYNMEWLFDQALASEALLRCGWTEEARVLLDRNIRSNIGPDGRTTESSRWFGFDYTELNQNGNLLYSLWNYVAWTGDLAFAKRHWKKIVLCGDFPLQPRFLDPHTHMVHNKREFWERSDTFGMQDGYEQSYQFWVSFGLTKGALLAEALGDKAVASRWRVAATQMRDAMLEMPGFKLIEDGHFIKRRMLDGTWQRECIGVDKSKMPQGSPLSILDRAEMEPDTITLLPIAYEMIDPHSALAHESLAWVDRIWNQRWTTGGYSRYNTDSEPDPPGAWPIASAIVARAAFEAGDDDRMWRVLKWLNETYGGKSGGWFERYAQSITPPAPPVGVIPWIWYELIGLTVHHIAGVRPDLDALHVRPRLPSGVDHVNIRVPVRAAWYEVEIRRGDGAPRAIVNGRTVAYTAEGIRLPYGKAGSITHISVFV